MAGDREIRLASVSADENGNADGTWSYRFKDLPKFMPGASGQKIDYFVKEDAVTGYTAAAQQPEESVDGQTGKTVITCSFTNTLTGGRLPSGTGDRNDACGWNPGGYADCETGCSRRMEV